jgi:hypothetical protein
MADSPALRQQRRRQHVRGDHSLCVPGNCPALGAGRQYVPPPALPERGEGRVTEAVVKHLGLFHFPEGDPRGVETVIAIRLAQQLDLDGRPGVAHELLHVLSSIGTLPDDEADVLDELQMKHHLRRFQQLLTGA